jgi:uncharacterized protein (TIGR03067 family)
MILYALLVLAGGLSLDASDIEDGGVAKEYARLEGTWKVMALEVNGMKMADKAFKTAHLIIKGKEFTMRDPAATYRGQLVIDPGKTPKTIDMSFTEGPEKGTTSYGIYELAGDDFKLCLTITARSRPTEFATKASSGYGLEILRRERPKKD